MHQQNMKPTDYAGRFYQRAAVTQGGGHLLKEGPAFLLVPADVAAACRAADGVALAQHYTSLAETALEGPYAFNEDCHCVCGAWRSAPPAAAHHVMGDEDGGRLLSQGGTAETTLLGASPSSSADHAHRCGVYARQQVHTQTRNQPPETATSTPTRHTQGHQRQGTAALMGAFAGAALLLRNTPRAPAASGSTPGIKAAGPIAMPRSSARAMQPVGERAEAELYRLVDALYDGPQLLDKQHAPATARDQQRADRLHCSLLYGEIFYAGVRALLDRRHLAARQARTLYDLGMGCGRALVQGFLEHPHVGKCVGVELALGRVVAAADAVAALGNMRGWPCLLRLGAAEEDEEEEEDGDAATRVHAQAVSVSVCGATGAAAAAAASVSVSGEVSRGGLAAAGQQLLGAVRALTHSSTGTQGARVGGGITGNAAAAEAHGGVPRPSSLGTDRHGPLPLPVPLMHPLGGTQHNPATGTHATPVTAQSAQSALVGELTRTAFERTRRRALALVRAHRDSLRAWTWWAWGGGRAVRAAGEREGWLRTLASLAGGGEDGGEGVGVNGTARVHPSPCTHTHAPRGPLHTYSHAPSGGAALPTPTDDIDWLRVGARWLPLPAAPAAPHWLLPLSRADLDVLVDVATGLRTAPSVVYAAYANAAEARDAVLDGPAAHVASGEAVGKPALPPVLCGCGAADAAEAAPDALARMYLDQSCAPAASQPCRVCAAHHQFPYRAAGMHTHTHAHVCPLPAAAPPVGVLEDAGARGECGEEEAAASGWSAGAGTTANAPGRVPAAAPHTAEAAPCVCGCECVRCADGDMRARWTTAARRARAAKQKHKHGHERGTFGDSSIEGTRGEAGAALRNSDAMARERVAAEEELKGEGGEGAGGTAEERDRPSTAPPREHLLPSSSCDTSATSGTAPQACTCICPARTEGSPLLLAARARRGDGAFSDHGRASEAVRARLWPDSAISHCDYVAVTVAGLRQGLVPAECVRGAEVGAVRAATLLAPCEAHSIALHGCAAGELAWAEWGAGGAAAEPLPIRAGDPGHGGHGSHIAEAQIQPRSVSGLATDDNGGSPGVCVGASAAGVEAMLAAAEAREDSCVHACAPGICRDTSDARAAAAASARTRASRTEDEGKGPGEDAAGEAMHDSHCNGHCSGCGDGCGDKRVGCARAAAGVSDGSHGGWPTPPRSRAELALATATLVLEDIRSGLRCTWNSERTTAADSDGAAVSVCGVAMTWCCLRGVRSEAFAAVCALMDPPQSHASGDTQRAHAYAHTHSGTRMAALPARALPHSGAAHHHDPLPSGSAAATQQPQSLPACTGASRGVSVLRLDTQRSSGWTGATTAAGLGGVNPGPAAPRRPGDARATIEMVAAARAGRETSSNGLQQGVRSEAAHPLWSACGDDAECTIPLRAVRLGQRWGARNPGATDSELARVATQAKALRSPHKLSGGARPSLGGAEGVAVATDGYPVDATSESERWWHWSDTSYGSGAQRVAAAVDAVLGKRTPAAAQTQTQGNGPGVGPRVGGSGMSGTPSAAAMAVVARAEEADRALALDSDGCAGCGGGGVGVCLCAEPRYVQWLPADAESEALHGHLFADAADSTCTSEASARASSPDEAQDEDALRQVWGHAARHRVGVAGPQVPLLGSALAHVTPHALPCWCPAQPHRMRAGATAPLHAANALARQLVMERHGRRDCGGFAEHDSGPQHAAMIPAQSQITLPPIRCMRAGEPWCGAAGRVLQVRRGNLLLARDAACADAVVLEVKIRPPLFHAVRALARTLKPGARVLTYEDLNDLFHGCACALGREEEETRVRTGARDAYLRAVAAASACVRAREWLRGALRTRRRARTQLPKHESYDHRVRSKPGSKSDALPHAWGSHATWGLRGDAGEKKERREEKHEEKREDKRDGMIEVASGLSSWPVMDHGGMPSCGGTPWLAEHKRGKVSAGVGACPHADNCIDLCVSTEDNTGAAESGTLLAQWDMRGPRDSLDTPPAAGAARYSGRHAASEPARCAHAAASVCVRVARAASDGGVAEAGGGCGKHGVSIGACVGACAAADGCVCSALAVSCKAGSAEDTALLMSAAVSGRGLASGLGRAMVGERGKAALPTTVGRNRGSCAMRDDTQDTSIAALADVRGEVGVWPDADDEDSDTAAAAQWGFREAEGLEATSSGIATGSSSPVSRRTRTQLHRQRAQARVQHAPAQRNRTAQAQVGPAQRTTVCGGRNRNAAQTRSQTRGSPGVGAETGTGRCVPQGRADRTADTPAGGPRRPAPKPPARTSHRTSLESEVVNTTALEGAAAVRALAPLESAAAAVSQWPLALSSDVMEVLEAAAAQLSRSNIDTTQLPLCMLPAAPASRARPLAVAAFPRGAWPLWRGLGPQPLRLPHADVLAASADHRQARAAVMAVWGAEAAADAEYAHGCAVDSSAEDWRTHAFGIQSEVERSRGVESEDEGDWLRLRVRPKASSAADEAKGQLNSHACVRVRTSALLEATTTDATAALRLLRAAAIGAGGAAAASDAGAEAEVARGPCADAVGASEADWVSLALATPCQCRAGSRHETQCMRLQLLARLLPALTGFCVAPLSVARSQPAALGEAEAEGAEREEEWEREWEGESGGGYAARMCDGACTGASEDTVDVDGCVHGSDAGAMRDDNWRGGGTAADGLGRTTTGTEWRQGWNACENIGGARKQLSEGDTVTHARLLRCPLAASAGTCTGSGAGAQLRHARWAMMLGHGASLKADAGSRVESRGSEGTDSGSGSESGEEAAAREAVRDEEDEEWFEERPGECGSTGVDTGSHALLACGPALWARVCAGDAALLRSVVALAEAAEAVVRAGRTVAQAEQQATRESLKGLGSDHMSELGVGGSENEDSGELKLTDVRVCGYRALLESDSDSASDSDHADGENNRSTVNRISQREHRRANASGVMRDSEDSSFTDTDTDSGSGSDGRCQSEGSDANGSFHSAAASRRRGNARPAPQPQPQPPRFSFPPARTRNTRRAGHTDTSSSAPAATAAADGPARPPRRSLRHTQARTGERARTRTRRGKNLPVVAPNASPEAHGHAASPTSPSSVAASSPLPSHHTSETPTVPAQSALAAFARSLVAFTRTLAGPTSVPPAPAATLQLLATLALVPVHAELALALNGKRYTSGAENSDDAALHRVPRIDWRVHWPPGTRLPLPCTLASIDWARSRVGSGDACARGNTLTVSDRTDPGARVHSPSETTRDTLALRRARVYGLSGGDSNQHTGATQHRGSGSVEALLCMQPAALPPPSLSYLSAHFTPTRATTGTAGTSGCGTTNGTHGLESTDTEQSPAHQSGHTHAQALGVCVRAVLCGGGEAARDRVGVKLGDACAHATHPHAHLHAHAHAFVGEATHATTPSPAPAADCLLSSLHSGAALAAPCSSGCAHTLAFPAPVRRLATNTQADRVPTSWAVSVGHRFHQYIVQ